MTPRCRTANAFTLVELLIVVVIVGILAGLAIPRYAQATNHYRVSAAARKVAGDLSFVQSRARAASTTRTLSFNVVSQSYQLVNEPDPVSAAATYTVDLTAAPYSATISSVNFNNLANVSFNGFGVPSSGGVIVLQSGSAIATITLEASTGVVSIQ